eukprot:2989967-Rhodomonas_salina.1
MGYTIVQPWFALSSYMVCSADKRIAVLCGVRASGYHPSEGGRRAVGVWRAKRGGIRDAESHIRVGGGRIANRGRWGVGIRRVGGREGERAKERMRREGERAEKSMGRRDAEEMEVVFSASSYALSATDVRRSYALSGTDLGRSYNMSGTRISLSYAKSGTELGRQQADAMAALRTEESRR